MMIYKVFFIIYLLSHELENNIVISSKFISSEESGYNILDQKVVRNQLWTQVDNKSWCINSIVQKIK